MYPDIVEEGGGEEGARGERERRGSGEEGGER